MKFLLPTADDSDTFRERTGFAPAAMVSASQIGNLADVIQNSTFVWSQPEAVAVADSNMASNSTGYFVGSFNRVG